MKQFKLVNTLLGWITFAIAAWVYCSTIEPTASFWDCPEFVTTGYKLEVGHPPVHLSSCLRLTYSRNLPATLRKWPDGQHDVGVDECRLYPVPFLEHHAPDAQTGM